MYKNGKSYENITKMKQVKQDLDKTFDQEIQYDIK